VAYNFVGKRFGPVKVVDRVGSDKNQSATWLSLCDCDREYVLTVAKLRVREQWTSCKCDEPTAPNWSPVTCETVGPRHRGERPVVGDV
jgi:hypothetical protein